MRKFMAKATDATIKNTKRVNLIQQDTKIELPDLIAHQSRSFKWFVEEGLEELFHEITPVDDYTGNKLTL